MSGDETATGRPASASAGRARPRPGAARKPAWMAGLVLATLLSGCASDTVTPAAPAARATPATSATPAAPVSAVARPPTASSPRPARSLVRVPQPDYARPGSVAASFFTAWASVDAIHDGPDTYLARCTRLVTPALKRQLAASEPASAGWLAMRAERLVSLVRVRAVTRPAGAPAPGSARIYLRVYAQRVTTTTAGRSVTSDGITVQLTRHGRRWLISRLLFY
jgi:hypothetical protein